MPAPLPGPRSRRSAPRRTLAALAALILILGICIPAVSAEILINDDLIKSVDTSVSGMSEYAGGTSNTNVPKYLVFDDITEFRDFSYFTCTVSYNLEPSLTAGRHDFNYDFNGQTRPGVVYKEISTNALGQITQTRLTIFLNDWDIGTLSGKKWVTLPFIKSTATLKGTNYGTSVGVSLGALPPGISVPNCAIQAYYTVASSSYWKNHLLVENTTDEIPGYNITLTRTIDGDMFTSGIELYQDENIIYANTAFGTEFTHWQPHSSINKILISSIYGNFTYPLGSGSEPDVTPTPGTPATVTVYIQSSQTGALLAGANLSILASAGGTEVEVINQTLPGGTATYTLQPTGGGLPNPDYYRAIATVPGYTQIVENHSFTLTAPHDVIIEMRPDSGGPTDPENCYLEFYVRDFAANGIPSASIQCNSQIKQTNSAGYAVFEVAKNASYPYKVSKSGYVTIEGSATVADAPRYVANIVLGPGTVPTHTPTLAPGETPTVPGATPTPDTRTNEQKGQSVIDLIADFAEPIAILAILATIFGLMKMMTPGRR